jgi:hypothetical protein
VKSLAVHPGDTITIGAFDVANTVTDLPVTSGLTGTIQLLDHGSGDPVGAPTPITQHADDDWYVTMDVPSVPGTYRAEIAITQGGATRTQHLLLLCNR